MLRQAAFTGKSRLLKGGLHCHTTRSDGEGAPADVIALHEKNGYDFLALTDHRLYNYKNFLPGSKVTILPAMEMDRNIAPGNPIHCFHSVWLGPSEGNPFKQDQAFEGGLVKDQYEFQQLLDMAHEAGQLTTCCHPMWSGTPTREFEALEGNFAMELWNTGCARNYDCDVNNGFLWDELLMQGKRIFGIAADDGHHMRSHCAGYVRVNAENTVPDILRALKAGAFYASCGPEIYDFYIDDDRTAHIVCSPADHIRFCYGGMIQRAVKEPDGAPISAASLKVPAYFTYLRAEVTDSQRRVAWTNPIWLD